MVRALLAAVVAAVTPALAFAQEVVVTEVGAVDRVGDIAFWVLESFVFGLVGVVVLVGGYYLWELITPYSVRDELVKERNVAVAIVVAGFTIGTALIIAAAIRPS